MHEYTCAVVSVLILCFFLVLRIFWEEQLAEQFWYFNFSLYLVVFWAEQSKKPPCITLTSGTAGMILGNVQKNGSRPFQEVFSASPTC